MQNRVLSKAAQEADQAIKSEYPSIQPLMELFLKDDYPFYLELIASRKMDVRQLQYMSLNSLSHKISTFRAKAAEAKVLKDTVLHEAVMQDDIEAVKKLLSEHPNLLNAQDHNGRTALNLALLWRKSNIAEYLINDAKADVNIPFTGGGTPLHEAAFRGNLPLAKLLVEAKATLDDKESSNYGRTALNSAIGTNHFDIASYLVSAGADPSIADEGGSTPLHEAALKGNLPLVKSLVEAKANLNVKSSSNNGRTPLNAAIYMDRVKVAEYLVSVGADLTIADNDGNKPLKNLMDKENIGKIEIVLEGETTLPIPNVSGVTQTLFHKISLVNNEQGSTLTIHKKI